MAANNSYEQAVALIAAANRVVQDPNSVGAALRTISLRLRGTSIKELEEQGEDTTGAVESTSKLRSKVKSLSGVDILTDTGAYKDTYTILLEISKVWEDISDIDQAALLELLAGKTRSNTLAAILGNPEDLEAAYESAMNAEGSALRENEKYLDSIQGKIDQFNNAVQTMWNNTLDSGLIKWFVDLATALVKLVDNIGAVKLAFSGLITFIATKYFNVDFSKIFAGLTAKGVNKLFGKEVIGDIQSTKTHIDELKTSINAAKQAYVDNPNDANKKALLNAEESLATYEKLQKEGFKVSDSQKGYFGNEIQKIKDYKKQLKELEVEIPKAESELDKAKQDELNYGLQADSDAYGYGVDIDKMNKYSDAVKDTQLNVDTLKKKQQDLKNSGSGAFTSLAKGAQKLTRQIESAISSMLVMYAISKVIQGIEYLIDKAVETYEEAHESFEDLSSELENTKMELKNLESQLADVNSQIEEIQSNTPLTFTDQEELSRLQAQSAELERQIALTRTLQEQQEYGVNESAINAANKYSQTGVNTGKTMGENMGSKAGTGALVGAGIGVASGVGSSVLLATGLTATGGAMATGTAAGAWAGPLGMLIGAAIGALVGVVVGGIWGGAESIMDETVGDFLDNIKTEHTKLLSEYNTALANYQKDPSKKNQKKFEEAQKALRAYEASTAEYMTQMDVYMSQIKANWDTATDEQKAEYNEWADTMDTWAIESGGKDAKTNAINRIFGENAEGGFKKARDHVNQLKEGLKEAYESGDETKITEALEALEDFEIEDFLSDEEIQRLRDMGIYLYEAEDALEGVAKAEAELTDIGLEGVANDINKIAGGLGALKDAFDEVIEKGVLTAGTIGSLKEALGIDLENEAMSDVTAAWQEYLKVMMSGTATTEEMTNATNDLVQALLQYHFDENNLTPETKWEYVAQLKVLGIENAEEVVDSFLQQNMVKDLEVGIHLDRSKVKERYLQEKGVTGSDRLAEGAIFDEFSDEEVEEYAKQYGIIDAVITDEHIKEVAERYGVEGTALDGIIAKLKEKYALERDIDNLESQDADYNKWLEGDKNKKGFKALEEDFGKIDPETIEQYELIKDYLNASDWEYSGPNHYGQTMYKNKKTGNTISGAGLQAAKNHADEFKLDHTDDISVIESYYAALEEGEKKGYIIDGEIVDPGFEGRIDEVKGEIKGIDEEIDKEREIDIKVKLQEFDTEIDKIQDAYSVLTDAVKQYNSQGFLTLDTLQALLNLEPEYLALLKLENGQLVFNQAGMEDMIRTRLADAKATIIQNAIMKLNALTHDALATSVGSADSALGTIGGTILDTSEKMIGLAKGALVGAVALNEFEDAKAKALGTPGVDPIDVKAIEDEMYAGIAGIDAMAANLSTNFDLIVGGGGGGGGDKAETALEKIQKKYEGKLSNLENQKKYIENEIEALEAEDKGISKEYYKEQIALSEETQETLLAEKAELEALFAIDPSQDTADALWDVTLQLQEVGIEAIKAKEAIAELYKTAFQDIDDAYGMKGDLYNDQISYIEGYMDIEEIKGNVVPLSGYREIMNIAKNGRTNAANEKKALEEQLAAGRADGSLTDEDIAEMLEAIRESEREEQDFEKIYEENRANIRDWYVNSMSSISDVYDGKGNLHKSRISSIESYIDNEMADGNIAPLNAYKAIETEAIAGRDNAANKITSLQAQLDAGIADGSLTEVEIAAMTDEVMAAKEEWEDWDKIVKDNERAIKEWYSNSMSLVSKAYDNMDGLFGRRKNYIESFIELLELQDETVSIGYYNALIANEEESIANKEAENKFLKSEIVNLEEGSEAWTKHNDQIQANEDAILQGTIQVEKYKEAAKELISLSWDKVMNAFKNIDTYYSNRQDFANLYMDRAEALNVDVSEEAYQELIKEQKQRNRNTEANLESAYDKLNTIEEEFGADSQEYFDKQQEVIALEQQLYEGETKIIQWEQDLIEKRYELFNRFVNRINTMTSNLQNVVDLMSDDDMANEDGTWTNEGITSLGMHTQQMEMNKQVIEKTTAKIQALNQQYAAGEISSATYHEKYEELDAERWEAVKAYEASEDAIIDIHEARIDAIEEGINEEIEAYQELINTKKEELDAERELYSFRKDVQKQTKDIAALERRIASMSGSTDAATIAERTKLEAQLREAKENLDDTYYNHAMDSQSKALDDEMELFDKEKKDYIDELRESIEDTKAVIDETYDLVTNNAEVVLSTIDTLSSEYGFKLKSNLTEPWKAASENVDKFGTAVSKVVRQVFNSSHEEGQKLTGSLKEPWPTETSEGKGKVTYSEETEKQLYDSTGIAESNYAKTMEEGLNLPFKNTIDDPNSPLNLFDDTVKTVYESAIKNITDQYTTMKDAIGKPWEQEGSTWDKFDDNVNTVYTNAITNITNQYQPMKDAIDKPWEDAVADGSPLKTFATEAGTIIDNVIKQANEAGKAIDEAADVKTPSYGGTETGNSGGGDNKNSNDKTGPYSGKYSQDVWNLQKVIVSAFGLPVGKKNGKNIYTPDGYWGSITESSLKTVQAEIGANQTGKFDTQTRSKLSTFLTNQYNNSPDNKPYETALKYLPAKAFAKGTMGTTKDQWAIDSEPWLGDELVLVPTASGTLSYMRKGTSVVPADLTRELVDIANIGVEGLTMPKFDSGVSMVTNAINKPEIKLDIQNFLRCDNVSQDSMPELKKFVNEQMNNLVKQLNYGIKKFK